MKKFFKHNFNSRTKQISLLLLLLIIYVFICAFSYVHAVSSNIQNSVFRLHIIANSDSTNDQNLKYLVRNKVLEYIKTISSNITSKKDFINLVYNNFDEIKKISEQVIHENGYNYTVKLNIGNFSFPTKQYGDISLPAGFYDALKIEIGNANGQNWWCVMFPPLCFVDVNTGIVPAESKDIIKDNLSEEEFALISQDNIEMNLKFKIVEAFQKIGIKLAQI